MKGKTQVITIRCSEETKELFEELQEKFGTKNREDTFLRAIGMLLSDEERELEKRVLESISEDKYTLMKRVYLAELKTLDKVNLTGKTDEELKNYHVRGSASERVKRAIQQLMERNDAATEQSQRIPITPFQIYKINKSRREVIGSVFEQYRQMIDDHNAKYF